MAAAARTAYAKGHDREAVLRGLYGVSFPPELFALLDAGLERFDFLFEPTDMPWQLATPPERGWPWVDFAYSGHTEAELLELDGDLVPLVDLLGVPRHTEHLLCYRLSELAAGRATVVSVHPERTWAPGAESPSLLDGLWRMATARIDDMRAEMEDPRNFRTGAPWEEEDVQAMEEIRTVLGGLLRASR